MSNKRFNMHGRLESVSADGRPESVSERADTVAGNVIKRRGQKLVTIS